MKAFSYDPIRDSIFIEPGVLLGEVYDGLQSQGVAPVGGRVEFVQSLFCFRSSKCFPKLTFSLYFVGVLGSLGLLLVAA